ncbi:protein 5NUC [Drosophila tropicalis]|uniref:protein 5NUC n=1 Tax=Drosophila tropicalis TaxID=46794 RepID=UPI0035AC0B15
MPRLLIILLCLIFNPALGVKFSIIHNNDMHARYDPVAANYGKCKKSDDAMGLCFGGFARVATIIKEARSNGSVLYLNAGNTFQGTAWFTVYHGQMVAEMMNMLKPDALSLGTNEFDDGVDGLVPFLNKVTAPVVCCNIETSGEPKLHNHQRLTKSVIISKFNTKIGIVGYLTPNTQQMSVQTKLVFSKEIQAINNEARRLVSQGVNIIIALGHSGYAMDQQIAEKCPDVDVVVGGHSQTFLYTGAPPDKEIPTGHYPKIVAKKNGINVPVVQAFAYTKYMGKLDLEFDEQGTLLKFSGSPILLNKKVAEDKAVNEFLESRRESIDDIEKNVVGTTLVYLNGQASSCHKEECNFGNLIADSFVYARALQQMNDTDWTDAAIAFVNAGAIRASIESGVVTGADIASALPFHSELAYTDVKGRQLIDILEFSAKLRNKENDGGFLQVSGLRVNFNYNRPKGKRITNLEALCTTCKVPLYERVHKDKVYRIIMSTFLISGGDGHRMQDPDNPVNSLLRLNETAALTQYLQHHKVVYPMLENRIGNVEKRHRTSLGTRFHGPVQFILIVLFVHCTFFNPTKFILYLG